MVGHTLKILQHFLQDFYSVSDHCEALYIKGLKFNFQKHFINPFIPNAPFLYPLKTSENCKVFWCFQGVDKGCTGNI